MSDVGLLASILNDANLNVLQRGKRRVNLGTVYESVVAWDFHFYGYTLQL